MIDCFEQTHYSIHNTFIDINGRTHSIRIFWYCLYNRSWKYIINILNWIQEVISLFFSVCNGNAYPNILMLQNTLLYHWISINTIDCNIIKLPCTLDSHMFCNGWRHSIWLCWYYGIIHNIDFIQNVIPLYTTFTYFHWYM